MLQSTKRKQDNGQATQEVQEEQDHQGHGEEEDQGAPLQDLGRGETGPSRGQCAGGAM